MVVFRSRVRVRDKFRIGVRVEVRVRLGLDKCVYLSLFSYWEV